MIRIRRLSSAGGPPHQRWLRASRMASSWLQLTKRQGPLPTGCWPSSAGTGTGTTAATGIARKSGKRLSGSARVKVMVESSGTAMPATVRLRPAA